MRNQNYVCTRKNDYEFCERGLYWFIQILLLALCGIIIYLNIEKLPIHMDTDYIAEVNYSRLVWEERTLFPDSWAYATEFMFFRPNLLCALIYGVSGNYLLSQSLTLISSLALTIVSFWLLCKQAGIERRNISVGAIFLFCFTCAGRSFQVLTFLYYGYYAYYLFAMVFTVCALERMSREGRVSWIVTLILAACAMLLGIISIRMSLYIYLPLVVVEGIQFWQRRKRAIDNSAVFAVVMLLINAAGLLIGNIYCRHQNIMRLGVAFSSIRDLPANIWENLSAALTMVVGEPSARAFSLALATDYFLKWLLLGICFLSIIMWRKKLVTNYLTQYFGICFIAVVGATSFTTFGTGTSFYYFFVPYALAVGVAGITQRVAKGYKVGLLLISAFIALSSISVYYHPMLEKQRDSSVDALIEWLGEHSISNVAMSFWTAGPVEAYSNGEIRVAYLVSDESSDNTYYYLNQAENYNSCRYMVVTDDQEQKWIENPMSKLCAQTNTKIGEVGLYNIYQFDDVVVPVWQELHIGERVSVHKGLFTLLCDAKTENGTIVSSSKDGIFISGPYVSIEEGTYDIGFTYEVLASSGNPTVGWVDVSTDSGQHVLQRCDINITGAGEAILRNVTFENSRNVEFRVSSNENCIVKVKDIFLERKQ